MLDPRPKGRGFEPHRRHCVVSLSKNINPSLVLVQPRKTRPFITERLLMGRKETNQTNKQNFDTVKSGWSIVYIEGFQVIISKNIMFLSLKIDFVIANSADPNEMPPYAAFHLDIHCLP